MQFRRYRLRKLLAATMKIHPAKLETKERKIRKKKNERKRAHVAYGVTGILHEEVHGLTRCLHYVCISSHTFIFDPYFFQLVLQYQHPSAKGTWSNDNFETPDVKKMQSVTEWLVSYTNASRFSFYVCTHGWIVCPFCWTPKASRVKESGAGALQKKTVPLTLVPWFRTVACC